MPDKTTHYRRSPIQFDEKKLWIPVSPAAGVEILASPRLHEVEVQAV